MNRSPIQKTLWVSLPLGILLGATGALAGVSLLDEADEHVVKAENALRKAADDKAPGAFGGHRMRALDALGDARREIKKAKDYVGAPTPPTAPSPKGDSSSGPKKPPTAPTPPKKTDPVPPKKTDPTPPKKTDPVPPKKPPEPPPPSLPKK